MRLMRCEVEICNKRDTAQNYVFPNEEFTLYQFFSRVCIVICVL